MRDLSVIADDLTGACDVGGELARAGMPVHVLVDARQATAPAAGVLEIANTQSRTLDAAAAAAAVRAAVTARPAPVLLKKIDTGLRGHLGAELDAALAAAGAAHAFVVPAIPAAGRVTRDGRQWLDGRPLAETELARDPEGAGAESSVAAVLGRESGRRVAVLGTDVVRCGALAARAGALARDGATVFVVDAETDADVAAAVTAILGLPRPLCLAGSIALAGALARRLAEEAAAPGPPPPAAALRAPALVVSGSLHSRARAQLAALAGAGLAEAVAVPPAPAAPPALAAVAAEAGARLAAGRSVVLAAPAAPAPAAPAPAARRATEDLLAALARRIVDAVPVPALVLVGGETAYAVLRALGATRIAVGGPLAALVVAGEILTGAAAGAALVTKGGSGGDTGVLARLLADAAGSAPAARSAATRG